MFLFSTLEVLFDIFVTFGVGNMVARLTIVLNTTTICVNSSVYLNEYYTLVYE